MIDGVVRLDVNTLFAYDTTENPKRRDVRYHVAGCQNAQIEIGFLRDSVLDRKDDQNRPYEYTVFRAKTV